MAYMPWENDDEWLSPLAGMRPGMVPPPLGAPPPFAPPPPPPIAPATPSALDRLIELERRRPLRNDPNLEPSKTRKVLGGIAGALAGGAAGLINASGRTRVDPTIGARVATGITDSKLNKAQRDFDAERAGIAAQAQIENAKADDLRRKAESDARIASENAQQRAAEAAAARASRLETPKPIEVDPTKDLIDPVTREVIRKGAAKADSPKTIEERINKIRLDMNLSDTDKEAAVKTAVADYNALHPEKPVTHWTTDDAGNVKLISGKPTEAQSAGGVKSFGKIGKSKTPPSGTAEQNAASKKADEETALRILNENGGDHDKAIAAAPSYNVRRLIQEDKRRGKLGSDKGSGTNIDAFFGLDGKTSLKGKASTPAPASPYKVGDVVMKDGKKYRVKAIRPDGKIDVDPA